MKKLLVFLCVFVCLVSCIVLPVAFADNVSGGGVESLPYQFNGIMNFLGIDLVSEDDNYHLIGFLKDFQYSFIKNGSKTQLFINDSTNAGSYLAYDIYEDINGARYDLLYIDGVILRFNGFYRSTDSSTLISSTTLTVPTSKTRYFMGFTATSDTQTSTPYTERFYCPFWLDATETFTCNVVTLEHQFNENTNIIRYTDTGGDVARLLFSPCPASLKDFYDAHYRAGYYWLRSFSSVVPNIYYVQDISDLLLDEQVNLAFNQGKSDGYEQGFKLGDENGYKRGFREGLDASEPDAPMTMGSFFSSVLDVLDVKLFGLISLSTLLYIALGFIFIRLMFNLFK